MWFRRDLRLADNPALLEAISSSDNIVPVFILDKKLIDATGNKRLAYLGQSLRALDDSLGNTLHVMVGDQIKVLNELSSRYGATSIHISAEYEPYGVARDARIEAAGLALTKTGSPYAVAPGRVRKPSDGTPYRVYTPFYKAWCSHGWRPAAARPEKINAITPGENDRNFPDWEVPVGVHLSPAGEINAHERWNYFREEILDNYDETRNLAGMDGTSRLSAHLKWGEIHPRTLLSQLGESSGHDVFRKEIAWREFYADVLHHNPHTENDYYAPKFSQMRYDKPDSKFKAWQLGADFFMEHLVDFDVASNAHGWQWTAGCGTDASPYYRVFNPIEQGKRFDENGDYIKKYIPELSHLSAKEVHEPWLYTEGLKKGYPERIVDHGLERQESLARLSELKEITPKS